ncbi:phage holin family protein [Pseudoduganella sp. FT55W]|uniref:Phage holin family protein n=2 Tax=Duganella rivi TaxID=2666083 RepID=A0A7X4GVM1_9BURK|nr:phage holin family protein [Duganella rivi]
MTFYFLACGRVLLYRKEGARHRRHVSWIAWAILVVLAASGIDLLVNPRELGVIETARAILIDVFVFGARGNVARLLWRE